MDTYNKAHGLARDILLGYNTWAKNKFCGFEVVGWVGLFWAFTFILNDIGELNSEINYK